MSTNGLPLDRDGIFKALPYEWSLQPSEKTKSVAVSIGFTITAQLDENEWVSWEDSDLYHVRGWWYIVGKDGKVNETAVTQLVKSLGWTGQLKAFKEPVPETVVQITVKSEVYNNKSSRKATWMNPGDFTPEPFGASDDAISRLDSQFGSLLRAAAAAAKPSNSNGAKPAPPKAAPKGAAKPPASPPEDEDDIPFEVQA